MLIALFLFYETEESEMELIQSALSETLISIVLGIIALAGAYATYYLHLGSSKLKAQTAQIEDDQSRKLLETHWTT